MSFQGALDIAFAVARFEGLALVVLLLAARDADFELDISSIIVQSNWHYCQAFSFGLSFEFGNLFLREQEFAWTIGLVAFWRIWSLEGSNGGPYQKRFIAPNNDVSAFQSDFAGSNGFHFMTIQHQACFDCLGDVKIEIRLTVFDVGGHIGIVL